MQGFHTGINLGILEALYMEWNVWYAAAQWQRSRLLTCGVRPGE